ncbi:MAG TPA: bifunctional molybdenum cofactor biosynthesis protein MoaC/MoaB [Chitinophagaceae bacterium]|nr:bifunctional molybdenum cofactor biosynthesis protein MoaC/MoaB [Chitinophagaceae bacterium]
MINIGHKSNSLRQAIASAIVTVSKQETIEAIKNKTVPKGDVFEFSRAAGLLAIKKTSDVIPDCHPLPVEFASIKHEINGLSIIITVEVHTIYKTGVEVEAMHGAAITALTIYDMLKPIDKGIYISTIKLESKKGGKSDFKDQQISGLKSVVIVCSDSVSKKINEDISGKRVVEKLKEQQIEIIAHETIPDDLKLIQAKAKKYSDSGCDLLVFVGGTGLSVTDVTPDAVKPLFTREIPGIMEVARNYGQQRMPYAMLSRGVAGFINKTLVITLPGSPKGATETIDALFPYLLHVFKIADGKRHE